MRDFASSRYTLVMNVCIRGQRSSSGFPARVCVCITRLISVSFRLVYCTIFDKERVCRFINRLHSCTWRFYVKNFLDYLIYGSRASGQSSRGLRLEWRSPACRLAGRSVMLECKLCTRFHSQPYDVPLKECFCSLTSQGIRACLLQSLFLPLLFLCAV